MQRGTITSISPEKSLKAITRACSIHNIRKANKMFDMTGLSPELTRRMVKSRMTIKKPPDILERTFVALRTKLTLHSVELIAKNIAKLQEVDKEKTEEKLLNSRIRKYLDKVRENAVTDYTLLHVLHNKSVCASPDKRLKKYATIVKNAKIDRSIPSIESLAKTQSRPLATLKQRYLLPSPEKTARLLRPKKAERSCERIYNKFALAVQSGRSLETIKEKYGEIRKRWEIYERIVKNINEDEKEKQDGNGSMEFYLWKTAKQCKRSKSAMHY